MADLKMEEAKARKWAQEVQVELEEVQKLLDKIYELNTTTVGSNDVVFKMIEKVGTNVHNTWTATCDAFKRGWKTLEDGLKVLPQAVARLQETIDEFARTAK